MVAAPEKTVSVRDRAGVLREQHEARKETLRVAAVYEMDLIKQWRCFDTNCSNQHALCWRDSKNKQYEIKAPEHSSWANAIEKVRIKKSKHSG